MKRNVYANLSQGMDSFLRVAMTLRRKELEVESMSMSTESSGMQLTRIVFKLLDRPSETLPAKQKNCM